MALVSILSGAVVQAMHINQFYTLLTGGMSDQVVFVNNRIVSGSGTPAVNSNVPATEVAAFANGEVSLHVYNGGGVAEWRWRQPAHATGDWFEVGTQVGGTFTGMLRLYPSGGVFVGSSPSDPGASNLQVSGTLASNGNLSAGGNTILYANGSAYVGPSANNPGQPAAGNLVVYGYVTVANGGSSLNSDGSISFASNNFKVSASGGLQVGVGTLTGNTTLTAASAFVQNLDSTSGSFTVTLPSAPPHGTMFHFIKIDSSAHSITIAPGSGDSIAQGSTFNIAVQWDSWTFCYAETTHWHLVTSIN